MACEGMRENMATLQRAWDAGESFGKGAEVVGSEWQEGCVALHCVCETSLHVPGLVVVVCAGIRTRCKAQHSQHA